MKIRLPLLIITLIASIITVTAVVSAAEEKEKKIVLTEADKKIIATGKVNYNAYCFVCHGADGKGTANPATPGKTMGPALANSKRVLGDKDIIIRIVMHGVTGPIDGVDYAPQVMIGAKLLGYDDEKIAGILSYIRNNKDWKNEAGMISKEEVAKVRAADKDRATAWTLEELEKKFPEKK